LAAFLGIPGKNFVLVIPHTAHFTFSSRRLLFVATIFAVPRTLGFTRPSFTQ